MGCMIPRVRYHRYISIGKRRTSIGDITLGNLLSQRHHFVHVQSWREQQAPQDSQTQTLAEVVLGVHPFQRLYEDFATMCKSKTLGNIELLRNECVENLRCGSRAIISDLTVGG